MGENLLPHDMDEILESNKPKNAFISVSDHQRSDHQRSDHQRSDYQRSDHQRSDHQNTDHQRPDHQNTDYQRSDYQRSDYQRSDYQRSDYQRPTHINYKANSSIIEEKISKPPDIKKKNVFTKISNNISNRPKCYLILIIMLIIIILILLIYYKGILFIGPYCTNNIKSNAYKNKMKNNPSEKNNTMSLKESLRD
jgi:hypothetical protein